MFVLAPVAEPTLPSLKILTDGLNGSYELDPRQWTHDQSVRTIPLLVWRIKVVTVEDEGGYDN